VEALAKGIKEAAWRGQTLITEEPGPLRFSWLSKRDAAEQREKRKEQKRKEQEGGEEFWPIKQDRVGRDDAAFGPANTGDNRGQGGTWTKDDDTVTVNYAGT